jgi:hypothetical protein
MCDSFIEKAKLIHGGKYDYSLVEYVNNKTKVKILCPEHGVFEQRPNDHLSKCGCSKCINKFRLNTNTFIEKAKLIHGGKYDYSLVEYVNGKTKVKIICYIHGEFEQTPDKHLNSKQGCSHCSKSLNNYELINKLKVLYGNLYYPIDTYTSYKDKINFNCSKHGVFKQSAESLFKGHICRKCVTEKKFNIDLFINKSILIHGDKYDYSLVKYVNKNTKIKIICHIHGQFEQRPSDHLSGCGCPICRESKGEKKIRNYLISNNIKFIPQHRFTDCKNILPLPFDFYLPEYNTCIEYNGIQHYKPIDKFGGEESFIIQQKSDKIKKDFCYINSINLIIIKFDDDVIEVLTKKTKYVKCKATS